MGRYHSTGRTGPVGEAPKVRDRADRTVRATTVGIGAAALLGGAGLAVTLAGGPSAPTDPGAATTGTTTPGSSTPSEPQSGFVSGPERPNRHGAVAHSGGS
ncbi:MAG: hypothetical protein QOJ03_1935 [Frankiaceae bacterium]|jgi:hypothetical protein|nr:hypothetical protein [Frankiaceae bacterium]